MEVRHCAYCDSIFNFRASPSDIASGRGKYCSNNCKVANNKNVFSKGFTPWNKGKKNCIPEKSLISMIEKKKGKKHKMSTRIKMSNLRKGDKHHNWQGGITPINHQIRSSFEYRLWRESVFKRDDFTCVFCGTKGTYLHADHIKPFALYPELRFAIDNGRTLCVPCHRSTDTYGGRTK